MRNRELINLKKARNHKAKKDSKQRFKDISTNCWSYNLAKGAFNRKKYRWNYYSFKTVKLAFMTIEMFIYSLIGIFLLETLRLFAKLSSSSDTTVHILIALFWFLIIGWPVRLVKDYLEETLINRCNQLLAILEHDGEICWNKLSKNEQNILREYISKQIIKMQSIKLKKMTYGDLIRIEKNLMYLKSIDFIKQIPEYHELNSRIPSLQNYVLTIKEK